MSSWDVLVDLTPLDTTSRLRGIGRYVSELGHAIANIPEHERGVRVAGLVDVVRSDVPVDAQFRFAGTAGLVLSEANQYRYFATRRLFMERTVRAHGGRLVHLTEPRGTPVFASLPRVVTGLDLIPLIFPELYLSSAPFAVEFERARHRRRYVGARRVVAISQATKNDLVRMLGIDEARIDVAYLGVDHRRFRVEPGEDDATNVREAIGVDGPFILYVGAADARKNLARLIEAHALSKVARAMPLVVAGKLNNANKALIADAMKRSVRSGARVVFSSYVDDSVLPALYRRAVVHAFPSLYEGFGLPLLEALACGAPTLATDRSAVPEVTGDAALLVSGLDVEEMAVALDRLVGDESYRRHLAVRGPEQARKFTWDRCARETLRSYRLALEDV
jgi:glycosyltransferase involved in cell wall biosynthesis